MPIKNSKKEILSVNIDDASEEMQKYLKNDISKKTGKTHKNNLPDDCGITPDMIPKYCYYRAATDKRGDAFVIDRHPSFPKGKRQWTTSGSTKISTNDKFKKLKLKLKELTGKRTNVSGSKTVKKLLVSGVEKRRKNDNGSKTTKNNAYGSKTDKKSLKNTTNKKTNVRPSKKKLIEV